MAIAPIFAETLKVWGSHLPHHWSDWPKILDLVLWVPKQDVCQVSLKSGTVGFNSLGDLTQNDPGAVLPKFLSCDSSAVCVFFTFLQFVLSFMVLALLPGLQAVLPGA